MNKAPLELISGPCVLESQDLVEKVVESLLEILEPYKSQISFTFKGSFDKANRTSIQSYRGPGIDEGLKILESVNSKYGLPTLTDFHTPDQAEAVAQVAHFLQVPAYLCRQTDMIVEGAKACKKHNRKINVKKGQFISPEDTGNIVQKAQEFISKEQIFLTERGASFGYNNLIVDMSSFQTMKSFGVRTIHDATHCVQKPGALGKSTGGKRDQIFVLAKAATAAGADGVFLECHPTPEKALSDASTSLSFPEVKTLIESIHPIYQVV